MSVDKDQNLNLLQEIKNKIAVLQQETSKLSAIECVKLYGDLKAEYGEVEGDDEETKEAAVQQTEFNVLIQSLPEGATMMTSINHLRTLIGSNITEAKKIVMDLGKEGAEPSLIREKLSQKDAEELKAKLVAVGFDVQVE